jgi:hypothetical protein
MNKRASFYCTAGVWYIALICCAKCAAQTPQAGDQQKPQQAAHVAQPKENATAAGSTCGSAVGQPSAPPENALGLALIKNLARDQRALWTSPAHLRLGDATWLVPFAGLTAGFLVTDRDASLHLSNSPATLRHYTSFSNYGLAGMAGAGAGLYLLGKATNDEHKRETGLLSGEAALDGLFVATALSYATGRERPGVDSFQGKFWQGGDSFPSTHATTAWAIASA